ncbi:LacI family DNA-binding transcriptional regulator [Gilliamella sp. B2776]|uniref:LacI family DNA-binding transcriptional regulator n=1 Tax=unclassified Gilliamella TaxID=2685620 RepID=UPI00226AA15D|nr:MULTISPECIES: LacI family DNA-binding transcriptional regulator [unclassified Gilliamella]MCX8649457.1 LacI family DNA-binding transcriptional regulator [Gilliamella sp. B2779]MCX8654043.1 LacI family DNA-binding transcriptional regulator [Gilliamella sp. B2737]MCX8655702.1 LacI family DNA-binding transcriptional regulator [Gilliamella sp. B2894]MCX8663803.1 LacI family DNA-binding transcriptional regulator [Gilliamella sp. B2887]MCX8691048.1 LacI family DNA-binding transcriptional regulato
MAKKTLSTIAKQANLSIASVSRVLKKPHLTSPITQSKVYQAIEELNIDIHKNFKSRNDHHDSNKILVLDNQFITRTHINFGLEQTLTKAGFVTFYFRFPYHTRQDIHYLIKYISQHSFAGILVINDAPYLQELEKFKKVLPPIVLINHFSLNFICVHFDHLVIGHQITQYLLSNSHTKIAVLYNDKNKASSTLFLQGYKQALLRANLIVNKDYLIEDCFTYEHGKAAVKQLINSNSPPTAVICCDHINLNYLDEQCQKSEFFSTHYNVILGALHQAKESEIQLPKPLTITYLSHSTDRQYNELDKLSRINKPLYKMGQEAATLLCHYILNKLASTKHYHIIDTEAFFY